jgi:hypothetical protein
VRSAPSAPVSIFTGGGLQVFELQFHLVEDPCGARALPARSINLVKATWKASSLGPSKIVHEIPQRVAILFFTPKFVFLYEPVNLTGRQPESCSDFVTAQELRAIAHARAAS